MSRDGIEALDLADKGMNFYCRSWKTSDNSLLGRANRYAAEEDFFSMHERIQSLLIYVAL